MDRAFRLALPLAVALGAIAPALAADSYRLNPLDRLQVRVAKWEAAQGTMVPIEWLNGTYPIGADGLLNLPVVGAVTATGVDTAALSASITEKMQQVLAIADGLHVSVTIEEYAPVFVTGAVQQPGEFEFKPGLTVLQAVAIAGGVRRSESLFSRTDRDAVRALGDHRLLRVERWRGVAELARLQAELDNRDTIEPPAELEGAEMADTLLNVETAILQARRDEYQTRLDAIGELKNVLRQRIAKLEEEATLREELLVSVREEAESVASLVERGLAQRSRANEVARDRAELETRLLEIETAILEAEQQFNEAERDEAELIGDRRVTIITELQAARTELDRIDVRLETAEALFAEAARFGTTLAELERQASSLEPTMMLTRADAPGTSFAVEPTTTMRPGDVLQVVAPELDEVMPGGLGEGQSIVPSGGAGGAGYASESN